MQATSAPITTIDQFSQIFNRDEIRESLQQAERERLELVKKFPLSTWPTLTLEQYAYGVEDSQNTFSWALEKGTKNLALLAQYSSQAFKIYFRKKENRWWYEGVDQPEPEFKNEQEAWDAIRAIYLHAFARATAGRWTDIDKLHTSRFGPSAVLKALICYFPQDLLPITSTAHLKHFLLALGVVDFDAKAQNIVTLNRLLLLKLVRFAPVENWTTGELARMLYAWSPPVVKDNDLQDSEELIVTDEDLIVANEELTVADINDPIHKKIAAALEHKGQVILFGPPGTGKTFSAENFARSWSTPRISTVDENTLGDAPAQSWIVVSNIQNHAWNEMFSNGKVLFREGKLKANFKAVRPGDLVFGYTSARKGKIEVIAHVSRALFMDENNVNCIELTPVMRVKNGLSYDDFQKNTVLKKSQPVQCNLSGTLFKLTAPEAAALRALLLKKNAALAEVLKEHRQAKAAPQSKIFRLTFHPSYSYEDFVEGFRPDPAVSNNLTLRLKDGVFKEICKEADANHGQRYLILIDEINRANVAKVFGELITIIEKDKRGLSIRLPQSNEQFRVPPNVFVIGTMNTADRSIKTLDFALRRRFSFIEMQPDPTLLSTSRLEAINLSKLLQHLNKALTKSGNRDKQIGHSFFMENGEPTHNIENFGRQFRQDVLPLLQEFCYDKTSDLANFIGDELVDIENDCLREDKIGDDAKLASCLSRFMSAPHDDQ